MAIKYNSNIPITPLNVAGGPVDIRSVVDYKSDLISSALNAYVGLVVYVIEDSSLYVCIATGRDITTLEQGWKKVGNFDFNIEDSKPIDSRMAWDSWEDLVVKSNWPYKNETIYLYKGLMASVGDELWLLVNDDKFKGRLNTIGLKTLMSNSQGEPIYNTTREIAEFLGWKVVGADVDVDEHTLVFQK